MTRDAGEITVRVALIVDLNDQPITNVIEMPATYQLGEGAGLTVRLHIDGAKLARALAPQMMQELVRQTRNAGAPPFWRIPVPPKESEQ